MLVFLPVVLVVVQPVVPMVALVLVPVPVLVLVQMVVLVVLILVLVLVVLVPVLVVLILVPVVLVVLVVPILVPVLVLAVPPILAVLVLVLAVQLVLVPVLVLAVQLVPWLSWLPWGLSFVHPFSPARKPLARVREPWSRFACRPCPNHSSKPRRSHLHSFSFASFLEVVVWMMKGPLHLPGMQTRIRPCAFRLGNSRPNGDRPPKEAF